MSIPASAIVSVNPSVQSAGGQALDLVGLVLTTNTRTPIGVVSQFSSALDVANYFGSASAEAAGAAIYFNGFDGSSVKPARILFAQYPSAAVSAYLRSASLASMTLTQLKAITGQLTLTVNGVATTSASINLAAVTSFSNAATVIQAAFASPAFTVTFDSIQSAFLFTTNTTGATATMSFGSGAIADGLSLTAVTGAVTSQGAAATDPITFMNGVISKFTNFATFMTIFDPDVSGNANALLFAQWTSQQNNRYLYVPWDNDASPLAVVPATSSLGYLVQQAAYSGVAVQYDSLSSGSVVMPWFLCGAIASIDFTETNGRTTMKFRSQAGIATQVSNPTSASNLIANGYNFYADYGTGSNLFVFFGPGQVSGKYKWIDSYINQIWLNNALQLALMTLLTNVKSIPYNNAGYAMISAACMDPINAGLNFGAFQPGVQLSAQQIAAVNNAAGVNIASTLQNRGWYLQILPASAQSRAARTTPPINFWYVDSGSIQSISLASIEVQ